MAAQCFGMLKKAYAKVMLGVFDYKQSGKAGNTDPSPWRHLISLYLSMCFEMDISCLKLRNSYISLEISSVEIT